MARTIVQVFTTTLVLAAYICLGSTDGRLENGELFRSHNPWTKEAVYPMSRKARVQRDVSDDAGLRSAALDLIRNNRDTLCPYSDICEIEYFIYYPKPSGCCTMCTCEDYCVDFRSCCFNQTGRKQQDDTFSECVYSSTMKDIRVNDARAYNMITKCPPGANETEEAINCGKKPVTMYGSLFPAVSWYTKKIYKNDICARCHDENVLNYLSAHLLCYYPANSDTNEILGLTGSMFKSLEAGLSHPDCFLDFPNNDFTIKPCFINIVDDCIADDFTLHDGLNATKAEIRDACFSGLHSPFIDESDRVFRNIFCYICSGGQHWPHMTCPYRDIVFNRERVRFNAIEIIELDYGLLRKFPFQHSSSPMACRRLQNVVDCRPIYCPTGQMYDGKGICATVFGTFKHEGRIQALFKLSMLQPISLPSSWLANETVTSPVKNTFNDFSIKTARVYVDQLTDDAGSLSFQDIYVAMERKFVTFKERAWDAEWRVEVNGQMFNTSYELSQFSSRYLVQVALGYTSFSANDTTTDNDQQIALLSVIENQSLRTVFSDPDTGTSSALVITKLFECNQIEFSLSEVQLLLRKRVVYIPSVDVVLHDGEFVIVEDSAGTEMVRVCLEDVGYQSDDETSFTSVQGNSAAAYICQGRFLNVAFVYIFIFTVVLVG